MTLSCGQPEPEKLGKGEEGIEISIGQGLWRKAEYVINVGQCNVGSTEAVKLAPAVVTRVCGAVTLWELSPIHPDHRPDKPLSREGTTAIAK